MTKPSGHDFEAPAASERSGFAKAGRRSFVALAFFLALLPLDLSAAEPAATAEIDHLLEFILGSDCGFVRNGREYGAERAHRHVLRKYNYFADEIETAEDFIRLAATRSLVSGAPYAFVCGGVEETSATVLLRELQRFRAESAR